MGACQGSHDEVNDQEGRGSNVNGDESNLEGIVSEKIDLHLYLSRFKRYDLDESDSMNSHEEIKQLTLNIIFALIASKAITNSTIPEHVEGAIYDAETIRGKPLEDGWTPRDFLLWFSDEIEPALIYVSTREQG